MKLIYLYIDIMKKIFTLALAALMGGAMAGAQDSAPSLTIMEGGFTYGGAEPLCVSNSGYACGSCDYTMLPFTFSTQNQVLRVFTQADGIVPDDQGGELDVIKDNGMALGWDDRTNMMVDAKTGTITRLSLTDASLGVKGALVYDMNQDNSIIVGIAAVEPGNYNYHAAYWENLKCHLLPEPTEEEVGIYFNGCRPVWVSGDGSIIAGFLIDRLATYPLVLWLRQEDGSYKLDPVFLRYWWDEEKKNSSPKPYLCFQPLAMNDAGTTIMLKLTNTGARGMNYVAYYDIATETITPVIVDGNNGIPAGSFLEIYRTGLSNAGTVVGTVYVGNGSHLGFIMYAEDKQPRILSNVFPTLERLEDYEDGPDGMGVGEYKISGISPNGRYITGMGLAPVDNTLDLYEGFVINTGYEESGSGTDAVEEVVAVPTGVTEYFTLDGRKVSAPVRGINIVRTPDGKTHKMILN